MTAFADENPVIFIEHETLYGARGEVPDGDDHIVNFGEAAIRRDGLDGYFEVWGVSDDVGLEKPDPGLFAHVLLEAGVEPPRSVMIGDRLDYDVRPAKAAGMRAIWLLRGEAPDDPTPAQLAEADAAIGGLDELPAALESLGVVA